MRFFTIICLAVLLRPLVFGQNANVGTTPVQPTRPVRLSFNSPYSEHSPVLSWDGKLLYFAKEGAPENLGLSNRTDIWYSRRETDFSWSPPVNVGRPLNDEGHSIPMSLSPLQDQLFVARQGLGPQFEYLYASAEGRIWKTPVRLQIPWLRDGSFPTIQIKGFQLSYDQQYFLFLAETPDGCGQLDIYVSLKKPNGQWGFPFNLGPTVNSDENECSVFLAADKQSLYFASNGREGMGGYDLYVSRRLDDTWLKWSAPLNLGQEINTPADERHPSLSMIGDELFFSRKAKDGTEDVFSCILAEALRPDTIHIIHGRIPQSKVTGAAPLQIRTVPSSDLPVIQSNKGKFMAVLSPEKPYLLFQPSPKGSFSESLAFFQKNFFDLPPAAHWNILQQNREYQERETHLQQLKNSRAQLLTGIREQEVQFNQQLREVRSQLSASLKKINWSSPQKEQLDLLKSKYQQLSKADTPADTTARQLAEQQQPAFEVVKKYDHFKKQKERLRRQMSKRDENEEDQAKASELTAKGLTIVPFDQMLQNLYHQWLSEALPNDWNQLEEQLLEARLQQLNGRIDSKTSDYFLKFGLPDELEKATELQLRKFSEPLLSLSFPWQRDIREDVISLLRPVFLERLPQLLRPHVEKMMDRKILLSAQKHQDFLMNQDIQAAISMQVAVEKKLPSLDEEAKAELSQANFYPSNGPLIQEHNFEVVPLKGGQLIPFPGIVFEPNQPRISPESEPEVNRLIEFLKQHPELTVEIGVYSYGSILHSTALELSTQRAEVLAHFISARGIAPERLISRGHGKKEVVDHRYSWRNNIVVVKLIE